MSITYYVVSFQYRRNDEWLWSVNHHCEARDAETAMWVWRHKGYGETRRMTATEHLSD